MLDMRSWAPLCLWVSLCSVGVKHQLCICKLQLLSLVLSLPAHSPSLRHARQLHRGHAILTVRRREEGLLSLGDHYWLVFTYNQLLIHFTEGIKEYDTLESPHSGVDIHIFDIIEDALKHKDMVKCY